MQFVSFEGFGVHLYSISGEIKVKITEKLKSKCHNGTVITGNINKACKHVVTLEVERLTSDQMVGSLIQPHLLYMMKSSKTCF